MLVVHQGWGDTGDTGDTGDIGDGGDGGDNGEMETVNNERWQQLGYHCSLHDAADGRSRISVGLESTPHSTSTLHWVFSKHNLSKGLDCKKKYGIPWMKVAGCVCDDEIKPVT